MELALSEAGSCYSAPITTLPMLPAFSERKGIHISK